MLQDEKACKLIILMANNNSKSSQMKKQLNIPTKEEAPTKMCPDSFTLHPEKGFTPLERKPWYLWWIYPVK